MAKPNTTSGVVETGIEKKKTEFDTAPTIRGAKTKKSGAGGNVGSSNVNSGL